MPLTQIVHVDRLLQAENAEAEGSLLKSVTKVESIRVRLLGDNGACHLGRLRLVGASDLIPGNTLKDVYQVSHSLPHRMLFMLFYNDRANSFLRDRQTGTRMQNSYSRQTASQIQTAMLDRQTPLTDRQP